jgi:hypothetical protein
MSDPTTPANPTPTNQTISLQDMAQRYLGALQRLFDTTAFIVEGTRQVNERTYDDFSASARFIPSQPQRRAFDAAKEESERWLLRNFLSEGLGIVVPLLEDIRSLACIADAQLSGSTTDAPVQKILTEDRRAFLSLELPAKLTHLEKETGITSPLGAQIVAMARIGGCLANRQGVVAAQDAEDGKELGISLVALNIVPTPEGTETDPKARMATKIGELRRTFAVGQTIKFEKTDYLNIVTTLSIFASSLLQGLQTKVQKLQAGKAKA